MNFLSFIFAVNDPLALSSQAPVPVGVSSDSGLASFLNGGKWLSAQIMHKQLFCPSKLSS